MSKVAFRPLIAACLAAAALTPTLAQARDDRERDYREDAQYDDRRDDYRDGDHGGGRMHDMAGKLRDPMNQAKAAAMLSALSGMALSMDVSSLTRAMDSVDGGRRSQDNPDATLGDLAGPRTRDLPYDIARKTPEAMGRLAGMLGALDGMAPQLKEMGRTLKRQLREQGLSGN